MDPVLFILSLIAWIITLRDISTSDFTDNSRTKWLILVGALNFIGMMFYYYYGIRRKEKYQFRFMKPVN